MPAHGEIQVSIFAVDTDGWSMNFTTISARIVWNGSDVVHSFSASRVDPRLHAYRAVVPAAVRSQPGNYLLSVELFDAWDETSSSNVAVCDLGLSQLVRVGCATGFMYLPRSNECRQLDVCHDSSVKIEGNDGATALAKAATDAVAIGESGRLIVSMLPTTALAEEELAHFQVRLVPLKLTKDFVVQPDGIALVALEEPGNFSLQIVSKSVDSGSAFSCMLHESFEVSCQEGFVSSGAGCQSVSGAWTVQMGFGIALSSLLVIVVGGGILFAIKHRENMKKLIAHFVSTELMMLVGFLAELWYAWSIRGWHVHL